MPKRGDAKGWHGAWKKIVPAKRGGKKLRLPPFWPAKRDGRKLRYPGKQLRLGVGVELELGWSWSGA